MTAKTTIMMGILIVASAVANVYLYQKTASLENTFTELQDTNRKLASNLVNANNNNQSSTTIGSPPAVIGKLPAVSSAPEQSSKFLLNMASPSITAVAVKAVPVTDGFFQLKKWQVPILIEAAKKIVLFGWLLGFCNHNYCCCHHSC